LKQDKFLYVLETLKDIEYANPQSIPLLFNYKHKTKEEADEEAIEASKDYHSGMMDPSREVAMFEKGRSVKKMIGRKKRMDINK
jgi:hypothetical protein